MSVEQIKEWLLSKGVTLWASWDLSQPERLHEAAVWFKTQSDDCDKFTNPHATRHMGKMMTIHEMDEFYRNNDSWDVV